MSRLQLSHILGSSTSKPQQLGFAQDFLIYISGSFLVFYSPVVDQQICYLKHNSPYISCIAVSPCEQFLAVCSTACCDRQKTLDSNNKKNNITVYKLGQLGVSQPTVSIQLKGHKYIIDHILFSPDSKYLVSICNKDGSMFVWDCKTGQRITQNKNSKSINCAKFMYDKERSKPGESNNAVYLVTSGRGSCKIWNFYSVQDQGNILKIQQQDQWIIYGKNIPFNKKFATKQFIDICFWGFYILLLTSDGLLCMINKSVNEQKLQKCIDLMITRTTSMDIYRNSIMCGGDNALVKIIDLQTLQLVRKFPRPPPIKKQNISKDYQQDQVVLYEQSEQFPHCKGIKTIGSNIFSQFIVTIYQNLTIFIWRPEPQQMVAMRSIITHCSVIKSVKILQQLENDLTFFSTISQDKTLRIWHIYKKFIYNRESIDIAKLIGINRNAYCRNLTRIIYMESQKQVTCIAGFCRKSIACIAHRQFIMYSLLNFEVVCHELLDSDAVALQIIDKLAYIPLDNGKVVIYQILQNQDKLHKIRQIQFKNKIKNMRVIVEQANKEVFLLIETPDTNEVILYSLKRSKIIYVEKSIACCTYIGHNIVLCKMDNTIWIYNILNNKLAQFLSLKHEISTQGEQYIKKICCNLLWIIVLTSSNKLIVANFSPAIVSIELFNENINDMAISDSGEIILVGDFGDIPIYSIQGTHGVSGMQQQIKKWMQVNDMSWLDGSVWTRKKSQRQLGVSVIDSIRLRSSINNPRSSFKIQLPNMEIKYKTQKNDQSIFNPSHILQQMKNIYKNVQQIQKEKKTNSNVNVVGNNQIQKKLSPRSNVVMNIQQDDDGLQEIKKNRNKIRPPLQEADSKRDSKKRIFKFKQQGQTQSSHINKNKNDQKTELQNLKSQFKDNLVDSIVVQSQVNQGKKEEKLIPKFNRDRQNQKRSKQQTNKITTNFSQFVQESKNTSSRLNVRDAGQISKLFQQMFEKANIQNEQILLSVVLQKLNDEVFVKNNNSQLLKIFQRLKKIYSNQNSNLIDGYQVLNQFSKLSKDFVKFIQDKNQQNQRKKNK